jgi:RNA polymerase sigma factor (sigma-70 family)
MTVTLDESLAGLLHRHRSALQGLAMTLLRDASAAQDAVSDAIEAILRRDPRLVDDAAALAYARAAVVNRARSMLRRQVTARRVLGRLVVGASAPAADERLLLADEHRRVLVLFDNLPSRQREVLTLRYFVGLTDPEIAQTLSLAPSTVRAAASRGLATLTRLIKENDDD